jgi:hypothetical protein
MVSLSRYPITLLPLSHLIFTFMCGTCWGQAIYPGVQLGPSHQPGQGMQQGTAPYQPKLSPYLDLLRSDNSLLSPYHTFVVPKTQVQRQQTQQALEITRLRHAQMQRPVQGTTSSQERLQTGQSARFYSYSHFYRLGAGHP